MPAGQPTPPLPLTGSRAATFVARKPPSFEFCCGPPLDRPHGEYVGAVPGAHHGEMPQGLPMLKVRAGSRRPSVAFPWRDLCPGNSGQVPPAMGSGWYGATESGPHDGQPIVHWSLNQTQTPAAHEPAEPSGAPGMAAEARGGGDST
eukprot:COSAG04_NODE_137_length_23739_cov_18.665764_6_plen_147_part_00